MIAPGFAPIFAANCPRNGLLPVRLSAAEVSALAAAVEPDPQRRPMTVDLAQQRVVATDGPVTLPDGIATRLTLLPLKLDGERPTQGGALAAVGQHTREVLLGLGLTAAQIEGLLEQAIAR